VCTATGECRAVLCRESSDTLFYYAHWTKLNLCGSTRHHATVDWRCGEVRYVRAFSVKHSALLEVYVHA
jgi:hypothetical protein